MLFLGLHQELTSGGEERKREQCGRFRVHGCLGFHAAVGPLEGSGCHILHVPTHIRETLPGLWWPQ